MARCSAMAAMSDPAAAIIVTAQTTARLRSTQARAAMRAHARAEVASECRACGEHVDARRSTRRFCSNPAVSLPIAPAAGRCWPPSLTSGACATGRRRSSRGPRWRPSKAVPLNRSHTQRQRRSSSATNGSAPCRR